MGISDKNSSQRNQACHVDSDGRLGVGSGIGNNSFPRPPKVAKLSMLSSCQGHEVSRYIVRGVHCTRKVTLCQAPLVPRVSALA